jgi:hypothetical protein
MNCIININTSHIIIGGVFNLETFIVGKIGRNPASQGNIEGVIERLSHVGYEFSVNADYYEFSKPGRIEAVITEMVPVCEDHSLDIEEFGLVEYKRNSGEERSRYENGRIVRSR